MGEPKWKECYGKSLLLSSQINGTLADPTLRSIRDFDGGAELLSYWKKKPTGTN